MSAPAAFAQTIASAVRLLLGLLLLGMVALNVANAICRYVFGVVLTGADEVLVFSMIWMVMVGMILATIDRRHIALDFLVTRAGPRQRLALAVLHHAVLTAACAYAAFYCWAFVARVAAVGQASMALGVPMAVPHFALVLGFAGTALASAALLAADVATLARGRQPA
jgi:TRAP-type C4-dicarboxylate transport system permease small subunit